MLRSSSLAFIILLTIAVVPRPAGAEQRHALVIGANPGWSGDRPLSFAESDAERVRDVLTALGGFSKDRVTLLRDPDTATVRAWLRNIATIAAASPEPTWVLVYYSGHADDTFLHLRGEPLSHDELSRSLQSLPAQVRIGVVDACKAGAVTHKGGQPVPEFRLSVVDDDRVQGFVLLSSSGADELSQESRTLGGSVFTHHFVSGLRGAADLDGDGAVTLGEAYSYAHRHTRADTASSTAPQRPAFRYELAGQGALRLTTLQPRSARFTVPAGSPWRYLVVDERELRVIAEVRPDPDRAVQLSVAPGSYHIKRLRDNRLEVAVVTAPHAASLDLEAQSYQPEALSTGIVKGRPDDLHPADQREWKRRRAYRLLADAEPMAALRLFDSILKDKPDDLGAMRGRARALLRLAEAYARVNDRTKEEQALDAALQADPSLTEDPMFQLWYQRIERRKADAAHSSWVTAQRERARLNNPRLAHARGIGFDLIGSRGMLVLVGSAVVKQIWFPYVGVDLAGPGVDVGMMVAPYPSRWSPYAGVGAHISMETLGLESDNTGEVEVNEDTYSYQEMFGKNVHVDGGVQFVGASGASVQLGLSVVLFQTEQGEATSTILPLLNLGWFW